MGDIRDYEQVFQDAASLLIKNYPFFGHIMARVVRMQTERVEAMSVSVNSQSQIILSYNTNMIKREVEENHATLRNIAAIIQHEVYHIVNEHFIRGMNTKLDRWVMTPQGPKRLFPLAADLAINQFIDHLPNWVLTLNTFQGIDLPAQQSAEIYYDLLLKHAQKMAKTYEQQLNPLGQASGILTYNQPQKENGKKAFTNIPKDMGGIQHPNKKCPMCDGTGTIEVCPTCGEQMPKNGKEEKKEDEHKGEQTKENDEKNERLQGDKHQQGQGEQQQEKAENKCPTCGRALPEENTSSGNGEKSKQMKQQQGREEQGQQPGQQQQGQGQQPGEQGQQPSMPGSQTNAGAPSTTQPCPSCNGSGQQQPSPQGSTQSQIDAINQWLPFDTEGFQQFLEDMIKKGLGPTSKQTGMPGGHQGWENVQHVPRELIHETIKQAVREAYLKAKYGGQGIGSLPAGIERMCKETLKPPYDFGPFLKRFIDGELYARAKSTRKRPNRRYRWDYPGTIAETKGKVGLLVDSSGSIYDEDIALFVKNIEQMAEYAEIVVFDVDTCIHDIRIYSKATFKKAIKGGGGTQFRDVFKILDNFEKNQAVLDAVPAVRRRMARQYLAGIKALVIMTDGQVMDIPKRKPRYPVMWALTKKGYKAPADWGKIIYLDNKPEDHYRRNY